MMHPSSKPSIVPAIVVKVIGMSYPWRRLAAGMGVLLLVAVVAAGIGSVRIPVFDTVRIVLDGFPGIGFARTWEESSETILWQLRLPRIVLAGIVGAALAMSGATYQGLFRNPLADPYLIGVASGAGLGAVIVLVMPVPTFVQGVGVLPVAAFIGAMTTVTAAYVIARSSEGLPLATLILAGVAIASLAGAVMTLMMMQNDANLRPVFSWLLGGFLKAQWQHSAVVLIYLVPSVFVMMAYGRVLNVMQLNEEHAKQLGVNVERTKILLIVSASLATAAAVSFSGLIGFVGLIAPHAVRLMWGVDYRSLIPMAAIVGAAFLILADLVSRTIVSPGELPVGVVTAFCGAPFFLYLLRYRRHVRM
jgi:iron complex transport system permease protein